MYRISKIAIRKTATGALFALLTFVAGGCGTTKPHYFNIDEVDQGATLLKWVEPALPAPDVVGPGLREIVIQVLVGPDGRVRDTHFDPGSGNRELDTALAEAAMACVFRPGRGGGHNVPSWSEVYYVYPEKPVDLEPCILRSTEAQVGYRDAPQFPVAARKQNLSGEVELRVFVLPTGYVGQAVVTHSSNPIFNDPCRDAARRTRFVPATRNCSPIASWTELSYKFETAD